MEKNKTIIKKSISPELQMYAVRFTNGISFTEEELQFLLSFLEIRKIKKGEQVLKAGETETQCRLLAKGLLRVYYKQDGRDICTQFIEPGHIACSFGSYTSQKPGVYFIEALENTILVCIDKTNLDKLCLRGANYVRFGHHILTEVYEYIEKRERELLSFDALQRLQHFVDEFPHLFLKLPQIFIASYLNIRPETLSHLKRKLVFE